MFGYFQTSTRTKLTFFSTTTVSRPVARSLPSLFSSRYPVVCAPCNLPHVVPFVFLVTHPCACARSPPVIVLGFCSRPLPLVCFRIAPRSGSRIRCPITKTPAWLLSQRQRLSIPPPLSAFLSLNEPEAPL
ncbi:uncharacterized protein LACBIDRAFT_297674 [Laccaria bicolor S238N-H82]|uniref:Predicted protein n=1 Tax=Laccaria bicolor (strain S238N-H82 / ATCC MYA-4686) TaxID=486041 RepID=B0DBR5_LACBS|nr:uncharacterized protein LACBIDRAFT_297674 [Laccaria bicolor S238N-H82]EDR08228.1 predicted protein [Laccaria bicolor S238N-H82]|eukprot:XP_001881298.1 predicted protein [Laccaria bicolor S238N-H82]